MYTVLLVNLAQGKHGAFTDAELLAIARVTSQIKMFMKFLTKFPQNGTWKEKFKTFLKSEKHSKTLKRFSSTLDCAIQDMQSAGVAAVAADTTAIVRHNCTHTSRASWSGKFLKT